MVILQAESREASRLAALVMDICTGIAGEWCTEWVGRGSQKDPREL